MLRPLLLCIVVGVAGVAIWLLQSDAPRVPDVPRPLPELPRQEARKAPKTTPVAPMPSVPWMDPAETRVEESPKDGFLVRLISHAPGDAMGGASVWMADALDFEDLLPADSLERIPAYRVLPRFQASGRLFRGSNEGTVRLPRPKTAWVVAVVASDLFGVGMLTPRTQEPLDVHLRSVTALKLRVIDANGDPVSGIPVALRHRSGAASFDVLGAETGPTGLAVLRSIDRAVDEYARPGRWVAGLAIPLTQPVEKDVDPRELPVEPLALMLPKTGTVLVRLTAAEGQALRSARVGLSLASADPGASPWWRMPRGLEVRFPHVGLSQRLIASVERTYGGSRIQEEFLGPTTPAEERTVTLTLPAEPSILGLRILTEDKAALATRPVRVRLEDSRGTHAVTAVTDVLGRAQVPLREARVESLVVIWREDGLERGQGRLQLAREFQPGLTSVGDVILSASPLLVSGRVVDAQDRGVPGAFVRVEMLSDGQWQSVPRSLVRTDSLGGFEIRGRAKGNGLRLRYGHEGRTAETPTEFSVGSLGLVLLLAEGSGLEGSLLVEDGIPLDAVGVSWVSEPPPGRENRPDRVSASVDDRGRFRLATGTVGRGRVEVTLVGRKEPLVTIEGVVVEPGIVRRPPELEGIPVRGLAVINITATDDAARPVDSFSVVFRDAEGFCGTVRAQGGHARIVTRATPLQVAILSSRGRMARAERVVGDHRVQLAAPVEVVLTLGRDVPIPEPPSELRVRLTPVPSGGEAFSNELHSEMLMISRRFAPVAADGRARVTAPGAGEFRVEWSLHVRRGTSFEDIPTGGAAAQVIQVRDAAGSQTFEARIDPKTVLRDLER